MQVMSVTGPIRAEDLGKVLVHEHIVISLPGEELDPGYAPDRAEIFAMAVDKLQELRDHGVGTIVDPCPIEMGRDPELYARVSQASGVKVIFATGFYYEQLGIPPYWRARDEQEITDLYLREIEDGVGSTGFRPGVIKAATGMEVTPLERRVLTAAAIAQRESGLGIITHTEHSRHGDVQQDIFSGQGASLDRVLIGHQDELTSVEPLLAIAESGSYIGIDRVGTPLAPDEQRADMVTSIINHGMGHKLCLSQDCICTLTAPRFPIPLPAGYHLDPADYVRNGRPLSYVLTDFADMLRERGVTDADLDVIFRDNPRKLLLGEP